jgi:predicted small metal-binding protein
VKEIVRHIEKEKREREIERENVGECAYACTRDRGNYSVQEKRLCSWPSMANYGQEEEKKTMRHIRVAPGQIKIAHAELPAADVISQSNCIHIIASCWLLSLVQLFHNMYFHVRGS